MFQCQEKTRRSGCSLPGTASDCEHTMDSITREVSRQEIVKPSDRLARG